MSMKKRTRKTACTVALTVSLSLAGAQVSAQMPGNIDETLKLPVNGLSMVRSGDTTMLISDNGRYVMKAEIYDMWNGGQRITTIDQMRKVGSRIQINSIDRFSIDDLFNLRYGNGNEEVVIFYDPQCGVCHQAFDQLHELTDDYTFQLVAVPMLGERSQLASVSLACAQQDEAVNALLSNTVGSLPPPRDHECGRESVMRNMITARQFGITGVPFIIADDGRTMQGLRRPIAEFLLSGGDL